MKIDIDLLRALFQGYAASRRPGDRRGCPTPRDIARSFESSLSRRRQRVIADHISECPACREEFTLFLEQKKAEDAAPIDAGPEVRGRGRRTPGKGSGWAWQGVSVLAGIGLSITAALVVIQHRNEADALRAGGSGLILQSPRAGQILTRPLFFRWEHRPDVEYYVLELFDDRMLPVWTSDATHDHTLAIPVEVASSLQRGAYYWTVTGFTAESRRIESSLSRFTLRQ